MFTEETKNKIRQSLRIKLLIVLATIILIVMMFPRGESIESEVNVGSIWIQNDLIASTTFEILKNPADYEKEKQTAAQKVQPIFIRDNAISKANLDSIKHYNYSLPFFITNAVKKEGSLQSPTFLSNNSFEILSRFYKEPKSFRDVKVKSLSEALRLSADLLDHIYQHGMLNLSFQRN